MLAASARLAFVLLFLPSVAFAPIGIPDPGSCTVPDVVFSPSGNVRYFAVIESSEGPMDSALVHLVFTQVEDSLCWCPGQSHPVVEAVTDARGIAEFFLAAGGCVGSGVEVYGNGVFLAEVGARSADVYPVDCTVGLYDIALITTRLRAGIDHGVYNPCMDLDRDGTIDLGDQYVSDFLGKVAADCSTPLPPLLVEPPGDQGGASIGVHIGPPAEDYGCGSLPELDPVNLTVWARPGSYPASYGIWIVACNLDTLPGFGGLGFGLEYDSAPMSGIDVEAAWACGESAGLLNPESGTGTVLTFTPGHAVPFFVAGVLNVTVYSPDRLRIVPAPHSGKAQVTDRYGNDTDLAGGTPLRLGAAGFDRQGYDSCHGEITGAPDSPSGTAPPRILSLRPNPFRSEVRIAFSLPHAGRAELTIHDIRGRRVATLIDGVRSAGGQSATWNGTAARGRPAAVGIYLAVLRFEGGTSAVRLIRLE